MVEKTEELNIKPFDFSRYLDRCYLPICRDGQRRTAAEGWNLLVPGGEKGCAATLRRAAWAEITLKRGGSIGKHDLVSYAVVRAFIDGTLPEYIDDEGNYVAVSRYGQRGCNLFEEIEQGKGFF